MKKLFKISDNICLDNNGIDCDIWHITQLNDNMTLDEIIINKDALKKLYFTLGEILIK